MKTMRTAACITLCLLCFAPLANAQCLFKSERNKVHNPPIALDFSIGRSGTAFGKKVSAAFYPLPCLNFFGFWEASKLEGLSTHGGSATVRDSKSGGGVEEDIIQVHGVTFSALMRIGFGPARVSFLGPDGNGGVTLYKEDKHEVQVTPDLRVAYPLRNGLILNAMVGRHFGGLAAQTFGGLDVSIGLRINPTPKGLKQLFNLTKK